MQPSSHVSAGNPGRSPFAHRHRGSIALLSVAAGLGVANLYYAQPLAATMASALGVSAGQVGLCLMACQLGYALGMLLLVPLGDGRERRRLMVQTTLATGMLILGKMSVGVFNAAFTPKIAIRMASTTNV